MNTHTSLDRPTCVTTPLYTDQRGQLFKPLQHELFTNCFSDFSKCDYYNCISSSQVFRGLHYQQAPLEQTKVFHVAFGACTLYCVNTLNLQEQLSFSLSSDTPHLVIVPPLWATGYLTHVHRTSVIAIANQPYAPHLQDTVYYTVIAELRGRDLILSDNDKPC